MPHAITAKNYPEFLLQYADKKYFLDLVDAMLECPYRLGFDNANYADTQSAVWATHAWVNPKTGTTILEEFIERHVTDSRVAAKILQAKNLIHDRFEVLKNNGNRVVTARAGGSGATCRIAMGSGMAYALDKGSAFIGLIHPWGADGTHKAVGLWMIVRPDK